MVHLGITKTKSFRLSGATCAPIGVKLNLPCNNRFLANFIQIGQHLWEWRPKCLFMTQNGGQPWLGD